jgi:hypothetical protein
LLLHEKGAYDANEVEEKAGGTLQGYTCTLIPKRAQHSSSPMQALSTNKRTGQQNENKCRYQRG